MSEALTIIALGLAAGVVSGLFGVGGGIVFVPALVLVQDLGQLDAEATSLLAMVPVAAVGAWRQHGYGNVRPRDALLIGALSIAGGVGGVVVANAVGERALEVGFGVLTLFIAAQLVRRATRSEPSA
jgi:uncharacterized membrane protein YfcA